jgi:hypothetical protein
MDDVHYRAIKEYYGDRKAKRSQVPLMNHIEEGLIILDAIDASPSAQRAYCIHPIVQADDDLKEAVREGSRFNTYGLSAIAIALAMEYRRVANNYLSIHYRNEYDIFDDSHLLDVNDMLIADKVQNRKDFELYHKGIHEHSNRLDWYFKNWLMKLEITEDQYQVYKESITF